MGTSSYVHENPVVDGWSAEQLRLGDHWRMQLPAQGFDEFAGHLRRNQGVPGHRVTDTEFPALHRLAADVRHELANGSGIAWIRPALSESLDDLGWSQLFSVFSSLLGMAHRPIELPDPERSLTHELTTTHVDGLVPDVIGSVRLSAPATGHEVQFCSTSAVHRDLELHAPELLRSLYRPVLHTAQATGEGFVRGPVFRYEASSRSLEFRYDRRRIEHTHDLAGVPLIEPIRAAFDALDKALVVPDLLASIRPGRGDIVLLNNRRIASAGVASAIRPGVESHVRALRVVNPHSTVID
jgi:hypothetical protein